MPGEGWKRSRALSRDHSPAPRMAITNPVMVRVITYSQPSPGRKMKKPLPRWLVTMATSITPITAAPPSGVSRPSTSSAPPTTSVRLASQACTMPGFMPRLANQRAVPAILPPPKMWLMPWASITAPTPHRSASRARLIESRSPLSIDGQRTGIDRPERPSVASAAMPKAQHHREDPRHRDRGRRGRARGEGGQEAPRRRPCGAAADLLVQPQRPERGPGRRRRQGRRSVRAAPCPQGVRLGCSGKPSSTPPSSCRPRRASPRLSET